MILAAPLAGWGLLQISAAVAYRVRVRHSPQTALLAGAAPLAAMLVVNLCVAWSGDVRTRAAAADLGHWVQSHYGSAVKMLGPDGITQVVNHYAQGSCESFPETASAAAVISQMNRLQPDVVLLSTDRRGPQGDEMADRVAALGFETVDRVCLPGGCEKLQVLTRISHRRVGGARKSLLYGALREPVQNCLTCIQGFDSVRNPPFSQRFAPRTLRVGEKCGLTRRTGRNSFGGDKPRT